MSVYNQYNPYQWPPNIAIAQLHYRCSMPGKQNSQGEQCPCCLKKEKLRTTNWISRDIYKDFKNFGGGIPAYFGLLHYYGISLIIIIILSAGFHIYCLNLACKYASQQDQLCIRYFGLFKLMTTRNIIKTLSKSDNSKQNTLAIILQSINFIVFLLLLLINFMVHFYLKWIQKKMPKKITILSKFSLFLKNIPKNYTVEDLEGKLKQVRSSVVIKEIVFLNRVSQYEQNYEKLLNSYFLLKYFKLDNNQKKLAKEQQTYIGAYENFCKSQNQVNRSTGRAIIVFQNIQDKEFFQSLYYKNNFSKFSYHLTKLIGWKIYDKTIYADKMSQPGEILWKYIGDSSIFKTKVRIQTTLTSIVFLLICYALLFFPFIYANNQQTTIHSGSTWNISVSLILMVMTVVYRMIMLKLSQKRKPNTHLSKSLFILLTTVLFHLLFYLLIPVIFYVQATELMSQTLKLKSLLTQVFVFLIISVILATIDLQYCCFQGDKRKYLSKSSQSNKYCQKQLHNLLSVPPFPIEFKLMVLYKIWCFVLFYSFQLPQLLIFILILVIYLYWNDKKNIYTHYKMQAYLPIELQQIFQQTVINFLLLYLCFSYMIVTKKYSWSFYFAPAITGLALLIKYIIHKVQDNKIKQQMKIEKGNSLDNILEKLNSKQQIQQELINEEDFRFSIDSTSLKSVYRFMHGYKESYNSYLHQFKNKKIRQLFQIEFKRLRTIWKPNRTQSELIHI